MKAVYLAGLFFYRLALYIASPFHTKARQWILGRKNWRQGLPSSSSSRKTVWFHCASLGEFEQARPLIERLDREKYFIVLTFFSPSGYEIRKTYAGADWVGYLPPDSKKNARDFVAGIKPYLVIFIKYEFWYYFLKEIKNAGIPLYLVSATFRKEQVFFKPWGAFYKGMLHCFSGIFVQNQVSAQLLHAAGVKKVTVAGDTRFDRALENAGRKKVLPLLEHFTGGNFSVIAGSCWPPEEEKIGAVYGLFPEIKWVLVPHDISETHIKGIEDRFAGKSVRYTHLDREIPAGKNVLIVDTIGILADAYRYGDVAIVGGGFRNALHNILEAAVQGMPVLFGPDTPKYPESANLVAAGGGFVFKNEKDLHTLLSAFFADEQVLNRAGDAAKNWINTNQGATGLIMQQIPEI